MITNTYDFVPFFSLRTVPTYWNNVLNSLTSDYSQRIGFKYLTDFYVEGQYEGTLRSQPFDNFGRVQLNSFTKNLLTYDRNWLTPFSSTNPNSYKLCYVEYGEEFSRKLKFNRISGTSASGGIGCSSSTILNLELDAPTVIDQTITNSQFYWFNRAYISKDLPAVNPQYNTFARIYEATPGGTAMSVILDYVPSGYTESGYLWEGHEFYDYSVPDGVTPTITTTLPHTYEAGDQIIIQMDNVSRCSVDFIGQFGTISFGETLTQINLIDPTGLTLSVIWTGSVTYNGTLTQFMEDIRDDFNCNQSLTTGFRMWYAYNPDDTLFVYSPWNTGGTYNDYLFSPIIGGNAYAGKFSNSAGLDANGRGLNPGLSGQYEVVSVPTNTTLIVDRLVIPIYDNPPGSERGTIYSLQNYRRKNLLQSDTFGLLHGSYRYNDKYQRRSANQEQKELTYLSVNLGDFGSTNSVVNVEYNGWNFPYTVDIFNHGILSATMTGTANGSATMSYFLLNTFTATQSIDSFRIDDVYIEDEKLSLGFGAWNINRTYDIAPGSFGPSPPTGFWPIDTNITNYKIAAYDVSNNQITNTYSFTYKCVKDPKGLTWLNDFGAWEYYFFDFFTLQQTDQFERSDFWKKGDYYIGDNNQNITYDEERRGTTTFNILADSNFTITTPIVLKKYNDYFLSMFRSPEIYLIENLVSPPVYASGSTASSEWEAQPHLIPITYLDSEVEVIGNTDKLTQYTINFKISQYKYYNTIGN